MPLEDLEVGGVLSVHTIEEGITAELDLRVDGRLPVRKNRGWLSRRGLLIGDATAVTAAVIALYLLLPTPPGAVVQAVALTAFLPLLLATLGMFGLYGHDEVVPDRTTPDDLPGILSAVTMGCFAIVAVGQLTGQTDTLAPLAVAGWALALALVPCGRSVTRFVARRDPRFHHRTLVLGAGEVGQLVARKLRQHTEYGLNVIGFLDGDPLPLDDDLLDVPVFRETGHIADLVRDQQVDRVIVAFNGLSQGMVADIVRDLRGCDVQVDIVPRLFEAVGPDAAITSIEGLQLVALRPVRYSPMRLAVKRALDIVVAALALVVLMPVMAAIALAVRIETRGSLLYRGRRVGRGGRGFDQLKYRTMRPEFCAGEGFGGDEADRLFCEILEKDPALQREFRETQKLRDDPRVTRVGRLLRKTSLDELPQLVNVLRGDLSLVGPRPITRREMAERYAAVEGDRARPTGYWQVPDLRPGLTGYWQISGRSTMSFDERIRLDTAYLNGWSLRLDLEILAKTARALLASRGAY